MTFLRGLKEYQLNLDAVYVVGGRTGGFYGGGGIGFRNSRFGGTAQTVPPRETVQTFSVVAGGRFGGRGRIRPQLEIRWIFIEETTVDPQQLSFGVSFALWGDPGPDS